jgi:hypothetical protein
MDVKMNDEIIIDENNFSNYFRDCRMNRPERGDVIARYSAIAEFIDGQMKKDIINLLMNNEKAVAATAVMRKLGCSNEADSIRICREVAEDLASGMTPDQVEAKIYKYKLESFYYTKKEYVPENDPHWAIISIANLDTFLDKDNQVLTMKSRIIDCTEPIDGEEQDPISENSASGYAV